MGLGKLLERADSNYEGLSSEKLDPEKIGVAQDYLKRWSQVVGKKTSGL